MKAITRWSWQAENGMGVVAMVRGRNRSSSCQRLRCPKENMWMHVGTRPKRKLARVYAVVGTSGQKFRSPGLSGTWKKPGLV